jgi:putative transcription factor
MCGSEIYSRPITIKIEGAELLVCPACAKHGKPVVKRPPKRPTASTRTSSSRSAYTPRTSTSSQPRRRERFGSEKELVTDYAEKLRLARQKMKLTQKEVSIQTKISVAELQSLETGKMRPSDDLIGRLEKFYNIKMTEEIQAYGSKDQKKSSTFQTLGDIVVIKKKKDEEE